jgi:hypothetical protein
MILCGFDLALAQPHYYNRLVQFASTIKFVHQVCISVFCILLENNLYCVIVRFGCIEVLGLSDFLSTIFLYSIFHSKFLHDRLH